MNREPIFFAWTRSFWLGWFPAILTVFDMLVHAFADPATATPVAWAVTAVLSAVVTCWNALPFPDWPMPTVPGTLRAMQMIAPLYALIVAQQRSHAARPYTIDPRARK